MMVDIGDHGLDILVNHIGGRISAVTCDFSTLARRTTPVQWEIPNDVLNL